MLAGKLHFAAESRTSAVENHPCVHGGDHWSYSGTGQVEIHYAMPIEHTLKARLIDDEALKLMRVMELLHIKREIIPSRYLSMFFFIAAHDPCHLKAVEEGLGISQGTASRGSDFLSATNRFGKPGLDWIRKEEDPLNATRMVVTLTPSGRSVVRQLKEILYG